MYLSLPPFWSSWLAWPKPPPAPDASGVFSSFLDVSRRQARRLAPPAELRIDVDPPDATIEQELSVAAGQPVTVSFTPHLLPISRGILSTMYANLTEAGTTVDLQRLYEETYAAEPFVRVLPAGTLPATQHVRGSNCCDIALQQDTRTGRLIVMSAIDNIVKGASGQAVQNMNLMCGFAETEGLMGASFFP